MRQNGPDRRVLGGILLLLAIVFVALVIFFLPEIQRKAERPYTLVAVLPETDRLRQGAPVLLAGKEVGRVIDIVLLPTSADTSAVVGAVFEVAGEARPFIRRDSELHVTAPNPLGAPVLLIMPGSPQAPVVEPGDTLRPPPSDLEAVLVAARDLFATLDTALGDAALLGSRVRERSAAIRRARQSTEAARSEYEELDAAIRGSALASLGDDAGARASLDRLRANTDTLVSAARERSARIRQLLADTTALAPRQRLAGRFRTLAVELERLDTLLSEPSGSWSRLAADSALAVALAGLRAQLDSLIIEARRNPIRYVF
ncbi:MAG: MlaD family protein [Longimicrobiales bacterium]